MEEQRRSRLWALVSAEAATGHGGSEWANAVCAVALSVVGVDAAALTVRSGPRAQDLLAATDEWAAKLEETQYTVGEGPGPAAYSDGRPVLVSDLAAQADRWPGFLDMAPGVRVGAVYAFPLQLGGIRLGTLTLYRTETGKLSGAQRTDAAVLADLATTSLLGESVADLQLSDAYHDVHVAVGMLAAQLQISLQDAAARLRAHAFTTGASLLDLSADVLARRVPLDEFAD